MGGGEFRFEEDFLEIVSFLALGAITGGQVAVRNSAPAQFPLIDRCFAKLGVRIEHREGWSRAVREHADGRLRVREPFTPHILQKIEAAPWPYLPADLLPIFCARSGRASNGPRRERAIRPLASSCQPTRRPKRSIAIRST